MIIDYTSCFAILAKLKRDHKNLDIPEYSGIEWIGEAMAFISSVKQLEERTAFIEVTNGKCKVPAYLDGIIQIARNINFVPTQECATGSTTSDSAALASRDNGTNVVDYSRYILTPSEILNCKIASCTDEEAVEVLEATSVKCDTLNTIDESAIRYYTPYFDLLYRHSLWSTSDYYTTNYQPVYPADHSFSSSLNCDNPDARELVNVNDRDEYTKRDNYLTFTFTTGSVAIAYKAIKTDENGYPMVPEHPKFKEAISRYVIFKVMEAQFFSGAQGATARMNKAEEQWHWYCAQAQVAAKAIHGLGEHENFRKQRSQMIPRVNRFDDFFGTRGNAENRQPWNDPNGYNDRATRRRTY